VQPLIHNQECGRHRSAGRLDASHDHTGKLPSMPGTFPDYLAQIVSNGEAGRELVPSSQKGAHKCHQGEG